MTPRQEKSTDLRATVTGSLPTTTSTPGWQLVKEKVGVGQPNPWGGTFTHGEGPTVFRDNENPDRWYMFIDQPSYHGGQGYLAFRTDDIAAGNWTSVPGADLPSSPRHGTVHPGDPGRARRHARRRYQPELLVTSVEDASVTHPPGHGAGAAGHRPRRRSATGRPGRSTSSGTRCDPGVVRGSRHLRRAGHCRLGLGRPPGRHGHA